MSAKLGRSVVSKAKIIAGDRGIPVAEYLTDLLAPLIDRDYLKMVRKLEAEKGENN